MLRRLSVVLRRRLRRSRVLQTAIVLLAWGLGEAFVRATGVPVSGGIVGMVLLLALLLTGRMSVLTVKRGADWMLTEMILFFVPALLSILDHPELRSLLALKALAIILVGTVSVMGVTGFTIELLLRGKGSS